MFHYGVMSIIITIIVGLVAGALGKFLMPGKDPGGIIVTILLGIAGAFVGKFVGKLPVFPDGDGGLLSQIAAATVGAVILLFIYRLVMSKKSK